MSSKKKSIPLNFLTIMSFLIRSIGNISPALGARTLALIWFKVTKSRANPQREDWLSQCKKHGVQHRGKTLSAYTRAPTSSRGQVVLLHGWSGRWDQLIAIANSLFEAHFEVIVFDFPSHGENAGDESDVFELSEYLKSVLATLNLKAPILICHSAAFLTVAHGMRMRKINCSKLITINSPSRFAYLIEVFREKIGFSSRMDNEIWKLIDRRVGVKDAKSQLATDHMSSIEHTNVLVIHDKDDKEVKFEEAKGLQSIWPSAELLTTSGLGHNRILSNPAVVEKIRSFCIGDLNA